MCQEIVIIGGGIAGLSAASELARLRGAGHGILVLEAEEDVALHSSSRSAQQLIPGYGPGPVLELTRWSIDQILRAGEELAAPLAWPSAFVVAGRPEDVAAMAAPGMRSLSREDLVLLCPELAANPERYPSAAVDDSAVRTDASALVAWHRARAEAAGVEIRTDTRVVGLSPQEGETWVVDVVGSGKTAARSETAVRARTVVNAAGSWAEHVGALAGATPQGLQPYRRTAALVSLAEPFVPEHPMVDDAAQDWYYRPDPVGAMISWGEAEPSEPCDATPHDGAVAALIETLERETALRITGTVKEWTGLRTSRPSDVPVCGWDTAAPGFFWLAGQGGYGFQTSSALARATAELVVQGRVGWWLSADTVEALRPAARDADVVLRCPTGTDGNPATGGAAL